MSLYPTLLFVHIVSALALFSVEGVALFALRELRAAGDIGAARQALARLTAVEQVGTPAPPLLLLSGLGLCFLAWGFKTPWVDLSLAGFLAIAVLVRVVDLPRLNRIRHALACGAAFGAELRPALHDPALRRGGRARYGLLLWLVGLMTVKPGLLLALGALPAVVAWALLSPLRRERPAVMQAA